MLHCKFYNRAAKEKGEVICESIANCGNRLRLCIVEQIDGAIDIINFFHEPTHLSISVYTTDLLSVGSV